MILLDSNIIMYAVGAAHAHKAPSLALLERVARGDLDAFVDAEVLQEILHRYRALDRWQEGRAAYDLARRVVRVVAPITCEITDGARDLLDRFHRLTARDAVHAAACLRVGNGTICSYDADFDGVEGIRRLAPEQVP